MKNKLFAIIALISLTAGLCGCTDGGSGSDSGSDSTQSSSTSSSKSSSAVSSSSSSASGSGSESTSTSESTSSGSSSSSASSASSTSSDNAKLPSMSVPATSYPGASSAYEIAAGSTTTLEIIDKADPVERENGNRLSYTLKEVWSQGSVYTVQISGAEQDKSVGITDSTTYVKDKLYGDFRLEIVADGEVKSSLKINVPRNDLFLILDSVSDGIEYGCDVLSSKALYGSEDYPDIIQLDFYHQGDYEVPQYARYFSVINGQMCELDIYENGKLVSPRGTHPMMKQAGMFIQHLCVKNGKGGYHVIQYEYRFDVANKRLNRKQVRFTGYNN